MYSISPGSGSKVRRKVSSNVSGNVRSKASSDTGIKQEEGRESVSPGPICDGARRNAM
jgi:hypothetical protein